MKFRVVVDDALVPVLADLSEREMRTPEQQVTYMVRVGLLAAAGGAISLVDLLTPPQDSPPVARGRTLLPSDEERLGPVGVERWNKGRCLCPTCPEVGRGLGLCQRHYMLMYYSQGSGPGARSWFVRRGKIVDRSVTVEDQEETLADLPRLPRGAISPEKDWLFDARETLKRRRALEGKAAEGKAAEGPEQCS